MNLRAIYGYVLAAVSLLLLAAMVVVLIGNAGDHWELHLFYKVFHPYRALVMLVSGALGVLLWFLFRQVLPAAVKSIREGHLARDARQTRRQLKQMSNKGKS